MKKVIAILLTLTMCVSMTTVFAADIQAPQKDYPQRFWDVSKDYWAFGYIAELTDRGVINGNEDGSFRPDDTVTRAEWAKIMVLAAGLQTNDNNVYFTDMTNHWANVYVNTAKDYLAAYIDGSFKPDQAAVREDVTVSMVKLKGYDINSVDYTYLNQFADTDSVSNDLKKYVAVAVEKGLINGFEDNTFRGQATLTRAEAATLLWRAFQYGNDNKIADTSTIQTPAQTQNTPPATNNNTVTPTAIPSIADTAAEPENTPIPTETPKPYKIETLIKANIPEANILGRYRYTFDGNDTIYYVENNNIYSVNSTGTKNTVITSDDLTVDNDRMTLSKFNIINIFCDTNTGELYVRGHYANINSAYNVNNSYLYCVTNGINLITDNFPERYVIGVLKNGSYFEGIEAINSMTFETDFALRNGSQEGFIETGNKIYYWAYSGEGSGYLGESNYDAGKVLWYAPINIYCAGFKNNNIIAASNNSIHTYNLNGKEISKITPDDYDITDGTKVDFSKAQSYRLMITNNNDIIFYDTSAKAFRMISKQPEAVLIPNTSYKGEFIDDIEIFKAESKNTDNVDIKINFNQTVDNIAFWAAVYNNDALATTYDIFTENESIQDMTISDFPREYLNSQTKLMLWNKDTLEPYMNAISLA